MIYCKFNYVIFMLCVMSCVFLMVLLVLDVVLTCSYVCLTKSMAFRLVLKVAPMRTVW